MMKQRQSTTQKMQADNADINIFGRIPTHGRAQVPSWKARGLGRHAVDSDDDM